MLPYMVVESHVNNIRKKLTALCITPFWQLYMFPEGVFGSDFLTYFLVGMNSIPRNFNLLQSVEFSICIFLFRIYYRKAILDEELFESEICTECKQSTVCENFRSKPQKLRSVGICLIRKNSSAI